MKTIVLAGDAAYIQQLETTIKSILYHNKECKLYLFHQDLPMDWLQSISYQVEQLGSCLVEVLLSSSELGQAWKTQAHITPVAYARYLISQYVPEDKVLYLDSDIVVNGCLDEFFDLDLQGHLLAAVRDANGSGFNSGVLLIDNAKWRQCEISKKLIQQTNETMELVKHQSFSDFNGDQTIFNQVFGEEWLELDNHYNLQVGHDIIAFYSHWTRHFEVDGKPLIIHYTTYRKPWNTLIAYRYRELWWEFKELTFDGIHQHYLGNYQMQPIYERYAVNAFIFTNSQDLVKIEELAESLPNVAFHIGAYTEMGEILLSLSSRKNIHLHPQMVDATIDELVENCDLYLDIHRGGNMPRIVEEMARLSKPILAFPTTSKNPEKEHLCRDVYEMMSIIQTLENEKKEMKSIVLGANYQYADQVLTTIKSICYHNRNVKCYVLNSDFPTEWFINLNRRLSRLGCQVVNARVDSQQIQEYKTNIHYTVFLRYFIPDFVEEDKVLYLDCDLVVTEDLTPLFETDLGDFPLAAVKDLGAQVYFGEHAFNSGVLLINNALWKEEQIRHQLIEMTNELHDKVVQDDQSILNLLFKDRWLALPFQYNNITLHTHFADYRPPIHAFPPIIHYLTERKPWNIYERSIYRDVWWFYNGLEWSDMAEVVPHLTREMVPEWNPHKALVYTFSCDLRQMEYLITQLPQMHFYIAAPVVVAASIRAYLRYENVSVLSDIAGQPALIDDLVERCDLLLDINAEAEVDGIVGRFTQKEKAVFAFSSVVHGEQGQYVFPEEKAADMVVAIRDYCESGKLPEPEEFSIRILDLPATLTYIAEYQPSVVRYGDGEMDIMMGHSIPYQDYDEQLSSRLKAILSRQSDKKLLVCLSDVFERHERYTPEMLAFWKGHLQAYRSAYQQLCSADWYGSTFISRPYMDLQDKSQSATYFSQLKSLWKNREIVIVEGQYSRSGVGNDLFSEARLVERIICPAKNAFAKQAEIYQEILKQDKKKLILLMLGPTAKVLAYDLSIQGYQAIDIGHIDSEYEWFSMGATSKVKFSHKHTAEHNFDQDILEVMDHDYESQIIARIGI